MTGWWDRAACRGHDTELWYPAKWSGPELAEVQYAVSICHRCPVRNDCLRYALDTGQGYGIWGGMSERARRALKRRTGSAA